MLYVGGFNNWVPSSDSINTINDKIKTHEKLKTIGLLTLDIVNILKRSQEHVCIASYNNVTINKVSFRTLETNGHRRTTHGYIKYYSNSSTLSTVMAQCHIPKRQQQVRELLHVNQRNGKDENEMQQEEYSDDASDVDINDDVLDEDECTTAVASIIGLYTIRNHEYIHLPYNEYNIAYVHNYKFKGKQFIGVYTKLSDRHNIISSPIIDLNTVIPVNIAVWPNDNKDEVFAVQINNDDNIELTE
jgi:hypothetical protein